MFNPIAIVGRACLLPKSNTPETLWQNVLAGKDCLMDVPENHWGVAPEEVLHNSQKSLEDFTYTQRGGYVEAFEKIFDAKAFDCAPEIIFQQDRLCQWLLHVGSAALQQINHSSTYLTQKKSGAIIGNLSYPTVGLSEYAQAVWITKSPHPLLDKTTHEKLLAKKQYATHRFMSGYPIHFMAKTLGLKGAASYAIDAACASSLYAIKLACDALQSGQADLMLAGGINQADDLFLHIGFSVLQAISKTGQSQPLHRNADGLIPAQGVAVVALKRLQDALDDKDKIYGVIRAIGLSNDGATAGFLAPSKEGQLRAMRNAYQKGAINPIDISWIECHATGTPVGDRIEIESMLELFAENKNICLGTLKANIGHTITVSGAASLINVLSAFEHKIKPSNRLTHALAMDLLQQEHFKLLNEPEPWICQDGERYAAINNFGFGGNNAHLVVQDWKNKKRLVRGAQPSNEVQNTDIAIILIGIKHTKEPSKKIEHIELPIRGIRFPPIDLEQTLGQQLILLELLHELLNNTSPLKPENTSIFIGMQCDAEIARYSLKWRLASLFPKAETSWLNEARSKIMPPLTAAHVIGCMPNIVTNRLNNQFGFQCPSFSVSAEELSGIRALQIATHALQNHEIDNAVVGAVDLSCEPVHNEAATALLPAHKHIASDMAVIFILKRLEDALKANDKIWGVLSHQQNQKIDQEINCDNSATNTLFGHAHAASGLLNVAAVAMDKGEGTFKIVCRALGDAESIIILQKKCP